MQASELHAAGLGWALLCLRMRYFSMERSNSLQQCCWVALGLSSIQWGMAAPTHQLFAPLVHPWGRKAPQRCLERAQQLQQGHNKGTLNFFPEEPLAGWAQAGEHMVVGRGGRMALLRGHEVQVFKPNKALTTAARAALQNKLMAQGYWISVSVRATSRTRL